MTRIVYFGNEQLAQGLNNSTTPIFDELASSDYEISAVVLPRKAEIVSRKSHELRIVESAKANGVKIIYVDEVDLENELQKLSAEIGVLVSYGQIVSQKVINCFPCGIVNVHPSLLPKYRGPTPIETTILNGDKHAGVSLMSLTDEMDAGPIFEQERISLRGDEDKLELCIKLTNLGRNMLLTALPNIISGKLKPREQSSFSEDISYTKKLSKTDGELDPATMTANECWKKIRAYFGFPRTRIPFHGENVIVTKAKDLGNYDGNNWLDVIKCSDNTALQIIEVISPKSGRTMKAADYLNGIANQ